MYKLILIAPDGDYVTVKPNKTVDECINQSGDMGSRWIFYPFHFIIKDNGKVDMNQRVIVAPDEMEFLKGKSLKNSIEYVKNTAEKYLM
jgi:hypothetical protein